LQNLTWDEFQKRSLSRDPVFGSLLVMAQRVLIIWPQWEMTGADEEYLTTRREKLILPPKFLAACNASTILQVFEEAVPNLNLRAFAELSMYMSLVIISCVADLDGANVRAKH